MAFYSRAQRPVGPPRSHASAPAFRPSVGLILCPCGLAAASMPLLLVLAAGAAAVCAEPPDGLMFDPVARAQAAAAIPFDRLSEESRGKLQRVVSQPSIYRRLPVTVIEVDPDLYLFLIRYPEVVVNMWELMGVTKAQVQRTGDFTFDATDGAGTTSHVELVYGDRKVHVLYADGAYEGPLFRRLIRGRCVLVLHSDYHQTMDQRVYVTNQLDMFVQFDNIGAELLAKTLHPLVGKTADHNFVESLRFLGQVSLAAETKTSKVQQLAERLTKIDPAVRGEFTRVTALVGQRAAARPGPARAVGPADGLHIVSGDRSQLETASLPDAPAEAAAATPRKPLRLRR